MSNIQKKRVYYTIECEAYGRSKENGTKETFIAWLEDSSGEYVIKKTFQSGRLIQSGIYDVTKMTRL